MKIKNGAKVNGLKTEILLAVIVASDIYKSLGQALVITELTGGKHSRASLHYVGYAVDLRTHYFSDNGLEAQKMLKNSLGTEYDVVLEKDHIHIEFQPKE